MKSDFAQGFKEKHYNSVRQPAAALTERCPIPKPTQHAFLALKCRNYVLRAPLRFTNAINPPSRNTHKAMHRARQISWQNDLAQDVQTIFVYARLIQHRLATNFRTIDPSSSDAAVPFYHPMSPFKLKIGFGNVCHN